MEISKKKFCKSRVVRVDMYAYYYRDFFYYIINDLKYKEDIECTRNYLFPDRLM